MKYFNLKTTFIALGVVAFILIGLNVSAAIIIQGGNNTIVSEGETVGSFSSIKVWNYLIDIGLIYPFGTSTDVVVIGKNSTSSDDTIFEVEGNSYFQGNATTSGSFASNEFCINTTTPDCIVSWPVSGSGGSSAWEDYATIANTLIPTTTNAGIFVGGATTTILTATGLDGSGGDLKIDANGRVYIGTDSDSGGAGASNWHELYVDVLTPTSTSAGLFIYASSTFDSTLRVNDNFEVNGNATTTGSFSAGQLLVDNTPLNIANWDTAYGWGDWSGEGFITVAEADWDQLLNKPATSTILSLLDSDYRMTHLNATTTLFDSPQFGNATSTNAFEVGACTGANIDFVNDMCVLDDVEWEGMAYGALTGEVTGNASTATASADNPTDCAAGSYPLGVDANWDVENCTDATTEIDSAIATHNSPDYHRPTTSLDYWFNNTAGTTGSSNALTWSGINTFSSDVRVTGVLHATSTDFDALIVVGASSLTGDVTITGNATTTITVDAAQFCISGANCITTWPAGSGLTDINSSELGQLSDVNTTTIAAWDILNWDGDSWENLATTTFLMAYELAAAETDPNVDTGAEIIAIIDNAAVDVGTGVWTFAGVTLSANENITLGAQTLDHDGTDFAFNDSVVITGNATSSAHIAATEFIQNGVSLASAYSPIAGSASIVTTGALTSGSTAAGFTVDLDASTLTCTNCIDVSSHTNITAGTNITLAADTLNVDDAFLINSADDTTAFGIEFARTTTTGTIVIPQGATPVVDADGEIAHDTTDNQLVYGADPNILTPKYKMSFTTASSTWGAYSKSLPIPTIDDAYTVVAMECYVTSGTSVQMTVTDGTNAMDTLTCATTRTQDDGTIANSAVTAGELMKVTVGTVTGAVDAVSYTIIYTIDRE